jgi:hypothetical protein
MALSAQPLILGDVLMAVYTDVIHCIVRVLSIEAVDGTTTAEWQRRYQSGYGEPRGAGSGLSRSERVAQDSMTRALLRRELPDVCWYALTARYSVDDKEVAEAIRWLSIRVQSPAHTLFKMKCVTAWAIPKRLPRGFYVLHTWDTDGTPDRTLREWRSKTQRWLDSRVSEGVAVAQRVLVEAGLIDS